MEPIFKNDKYCGNRHVVEDCSLLQYGSLYFFSQPKNINLEYAYYHFGLLFDSLHYARTDQFRKQIYNPVKDVLSEEVDTETLLSVQMGKDLNGYYDEKEADRYDSYYWRIEKAKQFNRPSWAYFMFLGNLQGVLNGNRMNVERMQRYLKLFEVDFLEAHEDKLKFVFNFFDERGLQLTSKVGGGFVLKRVGKPLFDI